MSATPAAPAPELESIFGAFVVMARELVRIAAGGPASTLVAELDAGMQRGAFVRLEFGLGPAGPLGLSLYAVRPGDGQAVELVTIAAPASEVGFRFGERSTIG